MDEFRFENTVKLTEAQYALLWTLPPAWRLSNLIRFILLLGFGIALFVSVYTMPLGVFLLALCGLFLFMPKVMSYGTRITFRKHIYLREPLTYGVSDQRIWVKGAKLDASVPWSMLVVWREKEGWLILSPSGIPPVYLSLAGLSKEGLYGRVRALAAASAPEFNSFHSRSH
ncbi:MAG TPA: hypothetical protein VHS05_18765 [Pyrinomonadaceae bacterium]|jgi:hypothetical protein|nr:hypothetical protein [Pyrinomonadaceae bacterium]